MKSTLKSTFGAMFDSFGYQLIANQRMAGLESATHLTALFIDLKIDLVIDIGAESGQFGIFLRDHVGYSGRIASFEAIPGPFNALQSRAAADELWEVEQSSLGACGGQLPLNVIDLKDFRPASEPRRAPLALLGRTIRVRREIVPIRTLDEALPALVARFDAKRIFLNLNARDQDRNVLKGAEKSLSKIAALQTKLSTTRKSEGMPHYLAMLSYFEAKHFSPNGFFPVKSRSTKTGSFDCCMINAAYA